MTGLQRNFDAIIEIVNRCGFCPLKENEPKEKAPCARGAQASDSLKGLSARFLRCSARDDGDKFFGVLTVLVFSVLYRLSSALRP